MAGVSVAACSPAKGHAAALSANDARLVELADAYEALEALEAELGRLLVTSGEGSGNA